MKKQKPPLCPKCGSEKVGFSDTSEEEMFECRLCDPPHLFEPPEHMKGRGPSKEARQAKRRELKKPRPIPSRERGDEFYWYVNDVVVEGLTFGGGYLPKPYLKWEEQHPTDSLKQWIEREVDKLLKWKRMEKDWRVYLLSTEPDKVLESVTSPQHCRDKILKCPDALKRSSADSLSWGLRKVLPSERERHFKQSSKDYAKTEATVKKEEKISSKTAADFLAPFLRDRTCSTSYIGTLARNGDIVRDEATGKILVSSLIAYRDSIS